MPLQRHLQDVQWNDAEENVVELRRMDRVQCQYKPILSAKEQRYVDFRFRAVCAFACFRNKQFVKALALAVGAFFTSPTNCIKEAQRYFNVGSDDGNSVGEGR